MRRIALRKVGYILVLMGIALATLFAFAQLNFAAAAFGGMAFCAWSHAFNLRFPTLHMLEADLKESQELQAELNRVLAARKKG